MPPQIIKEKCNSCGICADCCPLDVFEVLRKGEVPQVKYPDECWHCNSCVLDCPASAIQLRIPLTAMVLHVDARQEETDRSAHDSPKIEGGGE
jgi:adenylylsulfate reductase, subunit B